MPTVSRRAIACLAAAIMLLTSVRCVCGAGDTSRAGGTSHKHSCCGGDSDSKSQPKHRHDPACKHCQPALLETAPASEISKSTHADVLRIDLAAIGLRAFTPTYQPVCRASDLSSPPIAASTLLGLSCALTL